MSRTTKVKYSRLATKQFDSIPSHIARRLLSWVEAIEKAGVEQVRRVPGYHDEPLRGLREGQRSIRLNQAYRCIYSEYYCENNIYVYILEINKHDY